MADYGRQVWDLGQMYKARDAGMRVPMAQLLQGQRPTYDTPAAPQRAAPNEEQPSAQGMAMRLMGPLATMAARQANAVANLPGDARKFWNRTVGAMSGAGDTVLRVASGEAVPADEAIDSMVRGAAGSIEASQFAAAPSGSLTSGLARRKNAVGVAADDAALPLAGDRMSTMLADLSAQYQPKLHAGKGKPRTALGDMSATVEDLGVLAPRKSFSPEQFPIGSAIVGAAGDKARAGARLHAVNGQKLPWQVNLEGGYDFMRGPASQGADRSAWASNGSINPTMLGRAIDEGGLLKGNDVYLMYRNMGDHSGDYGHHSADTLLGMSQSAPITRKGAQSFDEVMRAQYPEWGGILNPDVTREQILGNRNMGKFFVKAAEGKIGKGAGLPDAAVSRFATIDPEMLHTPNMMAGQAITKLSPGSRVTDDPAVPHTSYIRQLTGGDYQGGFSRPAPQDMIWRDWAKQTDMNPKVAQDLSRRDYTWRTQMPVQIVDQQWIDTLMKYYEGR